MTREHRLSPIKCIVYSHLFKSFDEQWKTLDAMLHDAQVTPTPVGFIGIDKKLKCEEGYEISAQELTAETLELNAMRADDMVIHFVYENRDKTVGRFAITARCEGKPLVVLSVTENIDISEFCERFGLAKGN